MKRWRKSEQEEKFLQQVCCSCARERIQKKKEKQESSLILALNLHKADWFFTRVHLLSSNQTLMVIYISSLWKGYLHANQQYTDTGDECIHFILSTAASADGNKGK